MGRKKKKVQKMKQPHKSGEPFRVMELFPTIQGEGSDIGRKTIFLRLYGCNLACVWCDTAHSWDENLYHEGIYTSMSLALLEAKIKLLAEEHRIKDLVITGGEPLLHNHTDLAVLLDRLRRRTVIDGVTFETNGTIIPRRELKNEVKLFSVSPKLKSSGNPAYNPNMLTKWINRMPIGVLQLKFVISHIEDAVEVAGLIKKAGEGARYVPIIFQPEESANNYTELPDIIRTAFAHHYMDERHYDIRFIPQVHKLYGIR